jgi:hypothetical protein
MSSAFKTSPPFPESIGNGRCNGRDGKILTKKIGRRHSILATRGTDGYATAPWLSSFRSSPRWMCVSRQTRRGLFEPGWILRSKRRCRGKREATPPTIGSLHAEDPERIQLGCTMGRKPGRDQRDSTEEERHRNKDKGVKRLHAEEKTLEKAGEAKGRDNA